MGAAGAGHRSRGDGPAARLPEPRIDRVVRHRGAVRDRAGQRLAGVAVGAPGAAPARRLVRASRSTGGCRTTPTSRSSRRADIPGLNFAAVGDSYAYHTARDTPERLSRQTLRTHRRERRRDRRRRCRQPTSPSGPRGRADVLRHRRNGGASATARWCSWCCRPLALIAGVIAWVRVSGDAVRPNGVLRWLLTMAWGWLGALLVAMSMAGGDVAAALRARGLSPMVRAAGPAVPAADRDRRGGGLGHGPRSAGGCRRARHPARHPALTWSVTLPVWIAAGGGGALVRAVGGLSVGAAAAAPRACCSASCRPRNDRGRADRVAASCSRVSATLWLREAHDLRGSSSRSWAGCRSSRRRSSTPRC